MSQSGSRPHLTTSSAGRTAKVSARPGSTTTWFIAGGAALGLMFTWLGSPGTSAFDSSTVVPASQMADMNRQYARVPFGVLAGFEYGDPPGPAGVSRTGRTRQQIPPDVQRLSGTRIGVTGFMLPLDYDSSGVTKFILNANYDMCYYGAPTRPNDFVVVTMRGGRRTQFVHTPVIVYGTLRIDDNRRGDRRVSLYHMDGDAIAIGVQPRP